MRSVVSLADWVTGAPSDEEGPAVSSSSLAVSSSAEVAVGRWSVSWRAVAALVGLTMLAGLLALPIAPARAASPADEVRVVVRAVPGAVAVAEQAVQRAGGVVTVDLGIIDGFGAVVPAPAVGILAATPGVAAISEDYQLHPRQVATAGDGSDTELGSLHSTARMIGAPEMWQRGFTGKGVDVAVIDTGVLPLDGLLTEGKVLHGPDLSFDSQSEDHQHLDGYGHGTAMAGIIAGRDLDITDPATNRGRGFQGIAPDARVLSVKVGAGNGAVDVSQVIAAFDWVVQHRRFGGLNVRVINLAYGTDSAQAPATDPLAYATDVAWRKGLVVVASTGNDGRGTRLSMPAANPNILAVGAADHVGTLDTADDRVASFSTYAQGQRRPDLVAPGVGIVGLRAPGSHLDNEFPQAVRDERFFRGSGTSQAAAVTSGAVALLLEQRPSLTPDQVKQLLRSSATPLQATSNNAQGAGLVNLRSARTAPTPPTTPTPAPTALQGTGSLDAARGSGHLVADGVVLQGEIDIFAMPWVGATWAPQSLAGTSWDDGWFNGSKWNGDGWTTGEFAGSKWNGSKWNEVAWAGSKWNGSKWNTSWSGAEWHDPAWAGSKWNGSKWNFTEQWAGSKWNGSKWNFSRDWSGSKWNGDALSGQWSWAGWR
jgi:serine protease AprX